MSLQCPVFKKFCNKFIKTYALTFCLISSDIVQVLLFVCPTVSGLRFYGCCHPCFLKSQLQLTNYFLNLICRLNVEPHYMIYMVILKPNQLPNSVLQPLFVFAAHWVNFLQLIRVLFTNCKLVSLLQILPTAF